MFELTLSGPTLVVAAVVVALLLLPYVVTPVIVWRLLRIARPAKVVAVDPQTEPLPKDARRYFFAAFEALAAQGFELVGTVYLPDTVPHVKTLAAIYVNRATNDMAMSAFVLTTVDDTKLKSRYVEYFTSYANGVHVQTNNSRELSAFKQRPDELTTQFVGLHDLDLLYGLHRHLCQKHGRTAKPVNRIDVDFGGNVLRYMAQAVIDEPLAHQVSAGYFRKTDKLYSATLYGSLIMGWQELPPLKTLRILRRRQAARRVQAEFWAASKC